MRAIFLIILITLGSIVANAQSKQFPNELEGFEFFNKGKLHDLQLLGSTKADVKKVMGDLCENSCDYDEDWKVVFSYVSIGWSKTSNDQIYKPKAEFVGKLVGICFSPKRQILLTEANIFPREFECLNGVTTNSGNFKYNSRTCANDKRINDARILYSISNETISDGTILILNNQLMNIGYFPSKKDDDEIYALVEK